MKPPVFHFLNLAFQHLYNSCTKNTQMFYEIVNITQSYKWTRWIEICCYCWYWEEFRLFACFVFLRFEVEVVSNFCMSEELNLWVYLLIYLICLQTCRLKRFQREQFVLGSYPETWKRRYWDFSSYLIPWACEKWRFGSVLGP